MSRILRAHTPGGRLGKRLLVTVSDIMHSGEQIPAVGCEMNLKQGLLEMTSKGLGMTVIIDEQKRVSGIFTDGDLRRVLDKGVDVNATLMREVMNANCHTVRADQLAAEALEQMEKKRINALPVINEDRQIIGALNMHDLLQSGVI